jgi:hypothetical protein
MALRDCCGGRSQGRELNPAILSDALGNDTRQHFKLTHRLQNKSGTRQPELLMSQVRLIFRVLLPFAAGYYLSYLFRTINALIAADLAAELDVSAAQLGFLTSIYFLVFASAQLPPRHLARPIRARNHSERSPIVRQRGCAAIRNGKQPFRSHRRSGLARLRGRLGADGRIQSHRALVSA